MPSNFASDTLIISTNDKNCPVIKVPVEVVKIAAEENVRKIDGKVTDAFLNQSTDLLYITTSQPNQLVVYDINSRNIVETKLFNTAPICMAFSEDKSKMVIGIDNKILYLNVADLSEIKTINVTKNIFDIEFIDENTLYFTTSNNINYNLYYIDIQNETINIIDSGSKWFDEKTMIKKIPNTNYIVATRLNIYYGGLFVFNTNTKTLVNYVDEELGRFWFSNDGVCMINRYKKVLLTNNLHNSSELHVYSNINDERDLTCVAFSPHTNSFFCSFVNQNISNHNITKFSMNDLSYVKNYYYDSYYSDSYYGNSYYGNSYYTNNSLTPYYLFVRENETELIALKGICLAYNTYDAYFLGGDTWFLEFIPID